MKFILTDAGKTMESQLVAGSKPIITRIESGDTYSPNPESLQSVINKKQLLQVESIEVVDGKSCITFLLTNLELAEEYWVKQIGIYAKEDESSAEILYLIGQDATGELVPAPEDRVVEYIYKLNLATDNAYDMSFVVNTTDFARKQQVLELEQNKVSASGGDISATVTTVEEPASAADKYPAISGKGSTKTVLGKLLRWVKSLKSDKVDKEAGKGLSVNDYTNEEKEKLKGIASGAEVNVQSDWNQTDNKADSYIKNKPSTFPPSNHNHDDRYYTETEANNKFNAKVTAAGGDIANTKVASLQASTAQYPVPAAGDTTKVVIGKIKKFFEDIRNTATGACYIGQIVNNCVTNRADLPLSAAQGKALMDLYNVLNANLDTTIILNTYGLGIKIPQNADLNDYTKPGIYYSEDTNKTRTLKNVPPDIESGFRLEVKAISDNKWIKQFIYANVDNQRFHSRTNDGEVKKWNSWYVYNSKKLE